MSESNSNNESDKDLEDESNNGVAHFCSCDLADLPMGIVRSDALTMNSPTDLDFVVKKIGLHPLFLA